MLEVRWRVLGTTHTRDINCIHISTHDDGDGVAAKITLRRESHCLMATIAARPILHFFFLCSPPFFSSPPELCRAAQQALIAHRVNYTHTLSRARTHAPPKKKKACQNNMHASRSRTKPKLSSLLIPCFPCQSTGADQPIHASIMCSILFRGYAHIVSLPRAP